jgi:uracil-DNA glycosylase family 4
MAIQSPERTAAAPVSGGTSNPGADLGAPKALHPLYEVDEALRPLYETIADCPNCILAKTRSRTVPGSGPVTAELMFVGEAPGQREDDWGLPFVGRSGQFLDELLARIGLTRRDVYVTNVVKCRPPGNRDPEPSEIAACSDYLEQQIAMINPKVIATLGRFSMARWFPDARISRIHGQVKQTDERYVIPMYHPAAALRNGSLREVMHADFAKIPPLLHDEPLNAPPAPSPSMSPAPSEAASEEPGPAASERLL